MFRVHKSHFIELYSIFLLEFNVTACFWYWNSGLVTSFGNFLSFYLFYLLFKVILDYAPAFFQVFVQFYFVKKLLFKVEFCYLIFWEMRIFSALIISFSFRLFYSTWTSYTLVGIEYLWLWLFTILLRSISFSFLFF